jgi:chromosome partitioning protein
MRVWSVANQKGGVGKTTSAITLAGLLAARGRKTLLVDLDPHGSLTSYFGADPDNGAAGVYGLFQNSAAPSFKGLVQTTRFARLYYVPAATALATLDRQCGARDGMGLVLKRALAQVAHLFDTVLLDCPPVLGVLMVNALAACDRLLIPVQTEFLALKGLERMLRTLTMIQRARASSLDYILVPTLYDRRTCAAQDALRVLRERYGGNCWSGEIPVDTRFREASRIGAPLSCYQSDARGALAYGALLDHLLAPFKAVRAMAPPAQTWTPRPAPPAVTVYGG